MRTPVVAKFDRTAVDPPRLARANARGIDVEYLNSSTQLPIGGTRLGARALALEFVGDELVAITADADRSSIELLPHPAPDGGSNRPPEAALLVDPGTAGTTETTFLLDASASQDPDTGSGGLRYRWDFDGDGSWDTGFSTVSSATHRYEWAGSYFARVQVVDPLGLADGSEVRVDVVFVPDPGDPNGTVPRYRYAFAVSGVAFDVPRGRIYLADRAGSRVHAVNAPTGLVTWSLALDGAPAALALAPNGLELLVSVGPTGYTRSSPWDEKRTGTIAFVDLDRVVTTRSIQIQFVADDLLQVPDGRVVAVSTAGSRTSTFEPVTGALLGTTLHRIDRLASHPDGNRFYAQYRGYVYRFDLPPASGHVETAWVQLYSSSLQLSRMWVSPRGDVLLSDSGQLCRLTPAAETDLALQDDLRVHPLRGAFFDLAARTIFASRYDQLASFNLNSTIPIGYHDALGPADAIQRFGDRLALVQMEQPWTELRLLPHPLLAGETNQAPLAEFEIAPGTGVTTKTQLSFDAGATRDPDDGAEGLLFRWDLDSDGSWDTEWSPSPQWTHRFQAPGLKTITMQVHDRFGTPSTATRDVEVTFVPDAGEPGPVNAPYLFDLQLSDAAIARTLPRAYLLDSESRTLDVVDTTSGAILRRFRFDERPVQLSLSPDESRLTVRLYVQRAVGDSQVATIRSQLAVFDTAQDVKIAHHEIPFVAARHATGRHWVVVSELGKMLHVLDLLTGRELSAATLGSYATYGGSVVVLHSSERAVYASSWGSDYMSFSLSEAGVIEPTSATFYIDYGEPRISADGRLLFSRNPRVIGIGEDPATEFSLVSACWNCETGGASYSTILPDSATATLFTTENWSLIYRNLKTYLPIGFLTLDDDVGFPAFLGVTDSAVLVLMRNYDSARCQLLVIDHPNPGGGANTPPTARLDVSPAGGATTQDTVVVDAGGSSDLEDPAEGLQFRWDADGDDSWDGSFSSERSVALRSPFAGTRVVRVQVRDSLGLVGEASATISIRFTPDAGEPFDAHTPYELPLFPEAVAFDETRSMLWIADESGQRLLVMNLETGLVERQYRLGLYPARVDLTPDRSRLVVTTRQDPANYFLPWQPWPEYLVSIDLATRVLDRQFPIDGQATGIAALDDERTVVSGTWAKRGGLRAFDAQGSVTDALDTKVLPRSIAVAPSGRIFYAVADYEKLLRFDVADDGTLSRTLEVPLDAYEALLLVAPAGDALIGSGSTGAFELDPDPARDLRRSQDGLAPWYSAAFDTPGNSLLTIGANETLDAYALSTRLPLSSEPFPDVVWPWNLSTLGMVGPRLAVVEVTSRYYYTTPPKMRVRFIDHPVPDGGTNAAPEAALSITPSSSGTTRTVFTFDASASRDAEDGPEQLLYRWDLDGDGRWDGPFAAPSVIESRLPLAGARRVAVQVRDQQGRVGAASVDVTVQFEPDPGTSVPTNTPFQFTERMERAVFDSGSATAWLYEAGGNQLLSVDLDSGLLQRSYLLGAPLQDLKLVRGGTRLLVTLARAGGAGRNGAGVPQSHVMLLDLSSGLLDRQFPFQEALADADLTSEGDLAALTSGPAGEVRLVNGTTGRLVDSVPMPDADSLAVHPLRPVLYACQPDSSRVRRIEVSAGSALSTGPEAPGCGADRLRIVPDGSRLLTGAYPFALAADAEHDLVQQSDPVWTEYRNDVFFDPPRRGLFVGYGDGLDTYNLESLLYVRYDRIGASSESWYVIDSGIVGNRVVVLESRPAGWSAPGSRIRFVPHPTPGGGTNTPPTIAMTIDPPAGTTNTRFALDGSSLGDAETPREKLLVRWDLDGDGWWDTSFGRATTRQERFIVGGPRTVTAEARDELGLAARASIDIDVVFEPDPGEPVPAHEPFRVPVGSRYYGVGAAFDVVRPQAFAVDWYEGIVTGIDLSTGLAGRRIRLDSASRAAVISTDGATLSVLGAERGSEFSQPAVLSTIDTATATKVSVIRLPLNPFVIAPANATVVFVRGEVDERAVIRAIDPGTGRRIAETDDLPHGDLFAIAAVPTGRSVYLQAEQAIVRYDLRDDGTLVRVAERAWEKPGFASGLWASPAGDYLLADPGRLFRLSDDPAADLEVVGDFEVGGLAGENRIRAVTWDLPNREFHILGWDGVSWIQVRIDDLQVVAREYWDAGKVAIGKHGKTLFVASPDYGDASQPVLEIEQRHVNHAPRADAGPDRTAECTGGGAARVTLDGSGSTDGDSTPGTADDIVAYAWSEGAERFAESVQAERDLVLGPHALRLAVTDADAAVGDDQVQIDVVDTSPPAIHVDSPAAGQCVGPSSVPVVPRGSAADACTSAQSPVTFEPAGSVHGARRLRPGGERLGPSGQRQPHGVAVHARPRCAAGRAPRARRWYRPPARDPVRGRFESADSDSAPRRRRARGRPARRVRRLGRRDFGDGDGLLSDETLLLDEAALCNVARAAGARAWKKPELAVPLPTAAATRGEPQGGSGGRTLSPTPRAGWRGGRRGSRTRRAEETSAMGESTGRGRPATRAAASTAVLALALALAGPACSRAPEPHPATPIVPSTAPKHAPAARVPVPRPVEPSQLPLPQRWTETEDRPLPLTFGIDLDLVAPLGDGPANAAVYFRDFARRTGAGPSHGRRR